MNSLKTGLKLRNTCEKRRGNLDSKTKDGARLLDLPTSSEKFAELVSRADLPRLAAACVRAALDQSVVDDVKESGK